MMDKYLFFKMLLIGILTIHIEKNIPRIYFLFLGKKNPKSVVRSTIEAIICTSDPFKRKQVQVGILSCLLSYL
jgi:hypothetical protein